MPFSRVKNYLDLAELAEITSNIADTIEDVSKLAKPIAVTLNIPPLPLSRSGGNDIGAPSSRLLHPPTVAKNNGSENDSMNGDSPLASSTHSSMKSSPSSARMQLPSLINNENSLVNYAHPLASSTHSSMKANPLSTIMPPTSVTSQPSAPIRQESNMLKRYRAVYETSLEVQETKKQSLGIDMRNYKP